MPSNRLILCCPPSFPALNLSQYQGLFQWNWLLASAGQSIGASVSTSVLPMNLQVFPYHGYMLYFIKSSAPTRRGLMDQPSQDSCSHTHPSLLCLGEFSWSSSPDKPSILDYMLMGATQVVLVMKNLPANAGDVRDLVSTPGSGRSPGRDNGNPLQYSYLEKPMDRGAWRATVHGVAKSQTRLTN